MTEIWKDIKGYKGFYQVREIRKTYARQSKEFGTVALGEKYGVSNRVIGLIVRGKPYKMSNRTFNDYRTQKGHSKERPF